MKRQVLPEPLRRTTYGLVDGHRRTLEEVGKCLNLTRERIRQIETAALSALRNHAIGQGLRNFLEKD